MPFVTGTISARNRRKYAADEGGQRRADVGDGEEERDATRGVLDHGKTSLSAAWNLSAKRSGRKGKAEPRRRV